MNDLEMAICSRLQDEGVGSVYERVVLSRWFRDLAQRYGYSSVLEYTCPITRGYDNVALLDMGLAVTVADTQIERIRHGWKFDQRPAFSALAAAPAADLVWNFAQVQMNPALVAAMKSRARQHVLIFVPNILNPGTPVHLAYHLLTRTACRHAERGSVRIRTRPGLLRLLARHNITVIESGYVDVPPIPDIAFSIRELKQTIGLASANGANGTASVNGTNGTAGAPDHLIADPAVLWRRVQQMTRFENSTLVRPFKSVFGHHIYALGRVE